MTEDSVEEAAPVTEAEPAASEHKQPGSESALEHAKSSVIHAVETVVEKVTGTLGMGGHK